MINTNQVHEPNWILLITSGCMNSKKSNAVASESSLGHKVVSKTQIFYVSPDFLYLFPSASEIRRLFVIWLILGHHLLIIPAPNLKQYKLYEWPQIAKQSSKNQYFGVNSI